MTEPVGNLIFQGTNSLIYRHDESAYGVPIIVKVLKKDFPTPRQITQFNDEYEITKNLKIEGVRRAFERKKVDNRHTLVLEYIPGQTLKEHFTDKTGDVAVFLDVAIRIAKTLADVHRQGVIHKDINSRNILVDGERVTIIDFGIAAKAQLQASYRGDPNALEGTLAYISPEQTGRMNRETDHRSDLYSLGATYYDMLVGHPPFEADDPIEMIHCHIARPPPPIHELNPDIALPVSEIVSKLLAKNPEDRYLSAHGLLADLEACREQLAQTHQIAPFPLGQDDFSSEFSVSKKLYGREKEIDALLETFERVAQGALETMLVAGYSGVGKSALVSNLQRPIVEKRAYFVSGKFDQYQRSTPYSAFIQAFKELIDQLLTESPERLSLFRKELTEACSGNGKLLVDVIPNLELIVDEQPELPALEAAEAQNRFIYVFRRFVQVVATADHPLVLFIDDLQWADSASLDLLGALTTDDENGHFMLVGAYRENEVDAYHPFVLKLEEMKKMEAVVHQLRLQGLSAEDTRALVADTLRLSQEETAPLTELVYAKTQGNAFFVGLFLRSLRTEDLVRFDFERRVWMWDLDKIKEKNITDNVVELMAAKILELPEEAREALQVASCIGNQFDLSTLAVIQESSQTKAVQGLWHALEAGLLIPFNDSYKLVAAAEEGEGEVPKSSFRFLHDRVEQACYSLMPDDDREALHLRIGRALLHQQTEETLKDDIFDIVNQLNKSQSLIQDANERQRVAELNLLAGHRARGSTAYRPAFEYFTHGVAMLPDDAWSTLYDLTHDLHFSLQEVEYLIGDFDAAEKRAQLLLKECKTSIEKAWIYDRLMIQYGMVNNFPGCLELCYKGMAFTTGMPSEEELDGAIAEVRERVEAAMKGRDLEEMLKLPPMQDEAMKVSISLLSNANAPAYFTNQRLLVWIAVKMVEITLEHGMSPQAASAIISYAAILGPLWGEYGRAYDVGRTALRLSEQIGPSHVCRVSHLFASNVHSWVKPIREAYPVYDRGYRAGVEGGDWQYSGYILFYRLSMPFYASDRLEEIFDNVDRFHHFAVKTQNQLTQDCIAGFRVLLLNLRGQTASRKSFDDGDIVLDEYIEACMGRHSYYALCPFFIIKSMIHYLYGEYDIALSCVNEAQKYVFNITGKLPLAVLNFMHSLVLLKLYPDQEEAEQKRTLLQVEENQAALVNWANNCEENFRHKYVLVEAERARVTKAPLETCLELYDQAMKGASNHGFLVEEAMAYERAADFWMHRGKSEIAGVYVRRAYYTYGLWGAESKVRQMRERYDANLVATDPQGTMDLTQTFGSSLQGTSTTHGTSLDFTSVMKAAQTLSESVRIEPLLKNMISIVMQNAGASRAALIRVSGDVLQVAAHGKVDAETQVFDPPEPVSKDAFPLMLLHLVTRKPSPLVIDEAPKDERCKTDLYIQSQKPLSLLCFPVAFHGKTSHILYLENSLVSKAFTPRRLETIRVLAGQAAVSLENAELYENLEAKVAERTRQLELAQAQLVELAKADLEQQMAGGFAHEMRNALTGVAMVLGQLKERDKTLCQENMEELVSMFELIEGDIAPERIGNVVKALETVDRNSQELEEVLSIVDNAASRALNVTRLLLEYARLTQAKSELAVVNLNPVIEEVITQNQVELDAHDIGLSLECADENLVWGSRLQLHAVLNNLVLNARDALADVQRIRKIDIDVRPKNGEIRIQVRDNGNGIRDEDLAKIFDPFFSTKPTKGMGLGLNFASKMVSLMGGTIDVTSQVGQGTTFVVTLQTERVH